MRRLIAGFALTVMVSVVVASPADARSRKKQKVVRSDSRVIALLQRQAIDIRNMKRELAELNRKLRPDHAVSSIPLPPRNPALAAITVLPDVSLPDESVEAITAHHQPLPAGKTLRGYGRHIARSTKITDLTPPLAAKVREILSSCPGSQITSGYRRNARVRGSGRPSLHSAYPSKAADLQGNPSCVRRMLATWPGGLSTDYGRVRHYHVSYDPRGREWGRRFAHYGTRSARRLRYAQAR